MAQKAGRGDAPPALHGKEFTIKTEDDEIVIVSDKGTLRLEDEDENELGIQLSGVSFTNHNHGEAGMASVVAGTPADSSVDTGQLTDDAVTARKVSAGAIGSSEVADSAVGEGQLADDAVTSRKVSAGAIGSAEIADSAVTAGKIADSAIKFDDDEKEFFGTDDDVTERFDAGEDELKWQDELSATDRLALHRPTGNLIVGGTVDETSAP